MKQNSKTRIDMAGYVNKELQKENLKFKRYDKNHTFGVSGLFGKDKSYIGGNIHIKS